MKRNWIALIILTLACLYPSSSFAAEQTEGTTTPPETTEPSEELPTEPGDTTTITFTYIDVETNEEIAPSKSASGAPGTFVPVEVKSIPGYRVAEVMLINEIDFLETDFKFPITYEKIKETTEEPKETTPSSSSPKNEEVKDQTSPVAKEAKTQNETQGTEQPVESDENDETQTSTSSSTNSQEKTQTTTSTTQSENNLKTTTTKSSTPKEKAPLPKAGSQSQTALTVIGLSVITVGLLGYRRFKI